MAVKVIVPSKTYNEKYFGVDFVNGVGIFEDEKLAYKISEILGYKVENIVDKSDEIVEVVEKPKTTRKRTIKKVD